jgi:hypothetical protein
MQKPLGVPLAKSREVGFSECGFSPKFPVDDNPVSQDLDIFLGYVPRNA